MSEEDEAVIMALEDTALSKLRLAALTGTNVELTDAEAKAVLSMLESG